ncbi:MAG: hypothetical protein EA420_08000 [Candidatus Competibacteraceae bacterium]|nr:MAG: hypothetical protein EA420_08000 [Candidatus Competibacteraceae bacterium]
MSLNAPIASRSRAVTRYPLTLATHVGIKTYNRTFGRVEAALYLAEVVAHVQGRASAAYAPEIAQVNDAIARELARLEAFATAESRWIARTLNRAGPPDAIRYTEPARVDLTMRTPRARRYAALLALQEETLRALDVAWYAEALATRDHLARGDLLFRHFHRACGVIERLARGLARRVRDDTATPGYRDMLVKRTGRGPQRDEPPEPADAAADTETMTPDESASLRATEALVADWSAPSAGAEYEEPTAPAEPGEPLVVGEDTVGPILGEGGKDAVAGEVSIEGAVAEAVSIESATAGEVAAEDAVVRVAGAVSIGDAAIEDAVPAAGDAPPTAGEEDATPDAPPAPEGEPRRRRLREVLNSGRAVA